MTESKIRKRWMYFVCNLSELVLRLFVVNSMEQDDFCVFQ